MANKMRIIHHFLIKTEAEGKTIQNYELIMQNPILYAIMQSVRGNRYVYCKQKI